ncbi:MAG: hypothetical protein K2Q33_02470 [Gammaproteobacteria bacterium]|nr:hypothetical protein [Gammaproteobacteria bacterium]
MAAILVIILGNYSLSFIKKSPYWAHLACNFSAKNAPTLSWKTPLFRLKIPRNLHPNLGFTVHVDGWVVTILLQSL